MASSDSKIEKPQRGRPKRAELPDVNINTGAQIINTERALKDNGKTVAQIMHHFCQYRNRLWETAGSPSCSLHCVAFVEPHRSPWPKNLFGPLRRRQVLVSLSGELSSCTLYTSRFIHHECTFWIV